MILSTPVRLPRLDADMDKFDKIWETYGGFAKKEGTSPNTMAGSWYGFDVYTTSSFSPVYKVPECNLQALYPDLYNQLLDILPRTTQGIRFVMALGDFPAHSDNFIPSWQLRCMFHCNEPSEQWYYTRLDGTDRRPLILPDDSPWWIYRDGALKHGTIYTPGQGKILIQVFGLGQEFKKLADEGKTFFDPKYQIDY